MLWFVEQLRVSITDGGAASIVIMMVNQFFPSFRASHHHCTDTHDQYYGSSMDQSQPWKSHNIARESREIYHDLAGGNLKVNTYEKSSGQS
jgi:hypothetical protein